MQMPLCDLDSEKSQLEEQLLRFAGMDVANAERQMKEVAIKLFAVRVQVFTLLLKHVLIKTSFSSRVARKWSNAPRN